MADETENKPGLFRRLFGRNDDKPAAGKAPAPPREPAPRSGGTKSGTKAKDPARSRQAAPAKSRPPRKAQKAKAPETDSGKVIPFPRPPQRPAPAPVPAEIKPPTPIGAPPAPPGTPKPKGWLGRLADGLTRTSSALGGSIQSIFATQRLDAATLEAFEDALIQADLGVDMAALIADRLATGRYDKGISANDARRILAEEVARVLEPVARPLALDDTRRPHVVLVVGVNGSGKTTTIGKLAAQFARQGKRVVLAAGDTFRAAAIDQLKVWGERAGATVVAREPGADAAGIAHEALVQARRDGADVLLVDTAGRLQNKADLMAELAKIVRVLGRLDPDAPHSVLLVLDATTGQNAVAQADAFRAIAGVTGLVMTKLDGTARGGILVAIANRFALPVHAIGIGEGIDDLQPFEARAFADAIAGIRP